MNRPSFKKDNINPEYNPPSVNLNTERIEVSTNSLGDITYNKSILDSDLSKLEEQHVKFASNYDESELDEAKKYFSSKEPLPNKKNIVSSSATIYKVSPGVSIVLEENANITHEQLSMAIKILNIE